MPNGEYRLEVRLARERRQQLRLLLSEMREKTKKSSLSMNDVVAGIIEGFLDRHNKKSPDEKNS